MTLPGLTMVFVGGGLGALARYSVGRAVGERYTGAFPLGTCLINISGCFLLGWLSTIVSVHGFSALDLQPHLGAVEPLLGTGFLGGYTTFSTYALEGMVLLIDRARITAIASLVIPVAAGLAAAGIGALLGQHMGAG